MTQGMSTVNSTPSISSEISGVDGLCSVRNCLLLPKGGSD